MANSPLDFSKDFKLTIKKDRKVVKSNRIVSAREGFTLLQHRIILLMCARITPTTEEFEEYQIPIREILGLKEGVSIGGGYDRVRMAAQGLAESAIHIDKGSKWGSYAFISKAEGDSNEDFIRIQFDNQMKPFFLQLKDNYTQYMLDMVLKFKSQYSFRIYELMRQYHPKINKREFEIQKFREILSIENKYKSNLTMLRKTIIDVAVQEINELSDLHIAYDLRKTGRRFTHITFHIQSNKKRANKNEPLVKDIPHEVIQEKELDCPVWLDQKYFKDFVQQYSKEKVLTYCRIIDKKDKVENKQAYLYKALKESYFEGQLEAEATQKQKKEAAKEQAQAKAKMDALLKQKEEAFFAHYERRKMEVFFHYDSPALRKEYLTAIEEAPEFAPDRRYWNRTEAFEGEVRKLYSRWLLMKFGERRDYVKEEFVG